MPESKSPDKQRAFQQSLNNFIDTCKENFNLGPTEIAPGLNKQLQAVEEGAKKTSDVGIERSGPSNS